MSIPEIIKTENEHSERKREKRRGGRERERESRERRDRFQLNVGDRRREEERGVMRGG